MLLDQPSALLDQQKGGRFSITAAEPAAAATRRYIGDTNVLETTYRGPAGTLRVTDFMPVLAGPGWEDTLQAQRELVRIVECTEGEFEAEVVFAPRPDFARIDARIRNRGALGWACAFSNHQLVLHTDARLALNDDADTLCGRMRLTAGDRRYFSLTYVQHDIATIPPLGEAADRRLESTLRWWEEWTRHCTYEGPYRDSVVRSLLALKLMTFQLSGAVVAAPTASLPEDIGGIRNWDYRYCWLRDAALTFSAFADLGYAAEGDAFIGWLLHATRMTLPELQVLYDVYGGVRVPEEELDHLEGYRGSRPVRIGNEACSQLQLDTYGALILAVHNYALRGGTLEAADARMLRRMGDYVCRHWRNADKGIWELRGEARHNTHSKLMCWVALDCLLSLAEEGRLRVPRQRFEAQRKALAEAIETQGFDEEKGTYTGAFDMDYVEAGLLLLSIYGFVDTLNPRMTETCYRIDRELGANGLIYRHEQGKDGLPPGEGAFVICSFWMVEHLAVMGEEAQAVERFEHLLGLANDVGLLAEEADPEDGSALGNFPQAYSHVGLIRAAVTIEEMRKRRREREAPLDER